MVALVLLNRNSILFTHRLYLALYLSLLEEFVDLEVRGFELGDEIKVHLF